MRRLCINGFVLRTDKPIRRKDRIFKGRAGIRSNLRSYHLYLLKPRDQALAEAIERTENALLKRGFNAYSKNGRQIGDLLIETSKLKSIVNFDHIKSRLNCSEYEAQQAIERAMQLYLDIKEVKIFNLSDTSTSIHSAKMSLEKLSKGGENSARVEISGFAKSFKSEGRYCYIRVAKQTCVK